MARASTRTLLPLDRWFEIIGYQPIHGNQVVIPDIIPNSVCDSPMKQFSWQENAQIGREDIAQAIQDAERTMGDFLGYTLAPTWQVDERARTMQPADPGLINLTGLDLRGFRQHIETRWRHYIQGGIEAKTLIDDAAAIVYTDEDGDGYFETATVTVNTTVTEPCEIAVYFPGESGADEWEVRPLRQVVIAGGVAVIRMWRHQLVDPALWLALAPEAVDGENNANFLTTVDVYRHWTDPSQQATLLWEPLAADRWYNACGCGDSTCLACQFSTQAACLLARDQRLGLVTYRPATWDAEDEEYTAAALALCRMPDQVRLWYYAGWRDQRRTCPTLQMDPVFERAVAYYSLALLDRDLCGCDNLQAMAKHWREEMNLSISTPASSASYTLGNRATDNPFGQTRGAIYAWNVVNRAERKVGQAVKL